MRRVVIPNAVGASAMSAMRAVPGMPRMAASPSPAARVVQMEGLTMGTTWQVKCVPPAGLPIERLHGGIQARLDQVVAQMSTWDPGSDLSRFNRALAGTVVPLAAEFNRVLDYALTIARDSAGACDATAGALVNAWGFGPGSPFRAPGFQPPSEALIADARKRSGWWRLKLDPLRRTAVQPGGLQLDLSSIAKGFGVDHVALYLEEAGIDSFLVEVGGELRGSGVKPDGQPWWVRLEQPGDNAGVVDTVVALHGLSVATSGDYRRFFDAADSRYCHTIDPRSGRPVGREMASVTVLHEKCMAADALSTALMVMGRQEGLAWAERHGIAALFRIRRRTGDASVPPGGSGLVSEHMTERFAGLLN